MRIAEKTDDRANEIEKKNATSISKKQELKVFSPYIHCSKMIATSNTSRPLATSDTNGTLCLEHLH